MASEPRFSASADDLVEDNGLRVSRSIFTDPAIHALEIERIFNRTWVFLGHETEIPNAGDYVTRPMGTDNVIVWRGDDLEIRAFLNVCPHRGMQLCRADSGTARRFVCPYHTWTFDTSGALRATSFDQHYDKAAFARLGLTPVPKVGRRRGLIFGNWDAQACSLDEHLGGLGWYLDVLFGRTPQGMSVIGRPERWIIETNWKIPALNFIDAQHAPRTHIGPLGLAQKVPGARPVAELMKLLDKTPQITFPQGHGIVTAPVSPHQPEFFNHAPEMVALYKQALDTEQLAQLRDAPPGVGTIFPNTSWVQPLSPAETDKPPRMALCWRTFHPRDPHHIEVWGWYFAPAEASAELRAQMHKASLQTFGMGGTFQQDDAEVWTGISRSIRGSIASRGLMDFSAGGSILPLQNYRFPGAAFPSIYIEESQRGFIRRWMRQMKQDTTGERSQ